MNKKGVTLVELLIVIVVMGIISAFSVPAVSGILTDMNKEAILNSAETIEQAAKLYCSQSILDDCNVGDELDFEQLEPYLEGIDLTYSYTATKTDTNHWSVIYTKEDELSFPFDENGDIVDLQVPSLSDIDLVNYSSYGGGGGGVDVPSGPYVALIGSETVYVEIATTYTDDGVIGYDSEGTVIANTYITSDNLNMWALGTYYRSFGCWSSFDNEACAEATRTIVVQDTTDPVIYINGDETVYVRRRRTYSDSGAYALDNSTEYIAVVTTGVDDINTWVRGTYYVTYTGTDSSGNVGTAVRTVIVY